MVNHGLHKHCGDCKWVPKAEIALAICVHGAKCEVRRVAATLVVETAHIHTATHHFHFHMPEVFRFLRKVDDPEGA